MKIKRHQFITAILIIYGLFMTLYFGLDLLSSGQALRFWLTLGGEIVLIVMTYFALRQRDIMRQNRETSTDTDE